MCVRVYVRVCGVQTNKKNKKKRVRACVRACKCVYVCVCESKRERERERANDLTHIPLTHTRNAVTRSIQMRVLFVVFFFCV